MFILAAGFKTEGYFTGNTRHGMVLRIGTEDTTGRHQIATMLKDGGPVPAGDGPGMPCFTEAFNFAVADIATDSGYCSDRKVTGNHDRTLLDMQFKESFDFRGVDEYFTFGNALYIRTAINHMIL
ncbi:hypothetical protein ADUPG1_001596 [Aduncisulcus paluster]|uniref:Uncharacterized protein n=1 Tax=Aduncisulcus paluster TaxID=2918883 RepID=A0ABQ5KDP2_9EUKA|nr:hypothetical protein ADUPG1_001596 [Aduncisulcus paluster]